MYTCGFHRVSTPSPFLYTREGRWKSFGRGKYPPPPDWARRGIQPNHFKFRTFSAFAPMWTPPINESAKQTQWSLSYEYYRTLRWLHSWKNDKSWVIKTCPLPPLAAGLKKPSTVHATTHLRPLKKRFMVLLRLRWEGMSPHAATPEIAWFPNQMPSRQSLGIMR